MDNALVAISMIRTAMPLQLRLSERERDSVRASFTIGWCCVTVGNSEHLSLISVRTLGSTNELRLQQRPLQTLYAFMHVIVWAQAISMMHTSVNENSAAGGRLASANEDEQ